MNATYGLTPNGAGKNFAIWLDHKGVRIESDINITLSGPNIFINSNNILING